MNKDLRYYLSLKYPLIIREGEENGEKEYSLEIPDLPGCGAEGKTLEEAKERLEEAKKLWIEESLKRHLPIPKPGEEEHSGRILLRIPPFLHGQLRKKARQAGVSLNKYISATLESGVTLSAIFEKIESLKDDINEMRSKLEQMRPVKEKIHAVEDWGTLCATGTAVLSTTHRSLSDQDIPIATSGSYSYFRNWPLTPHYAPLSKIPEINLSYSRDYGLVTGEVNEKEER